MERPSRILPRSVSGTGGTILAVLVEADGGMLIGCGVYEAQHETKRALLHSEKDN